MDYQKENFHDLNVKKDGHLLWISLDRPNFHNSFSSEMINDFISLLKFADFDPSVRVIIITGEGKSFCAGGDVKAMANKEGMFSGQSDQLRRLYEEGIQQIPRTIESLQTPILAMVNGAAIGAGCDLAAMCDLRIGSEYAKFGETFCKLGLVPGDGGPYFLSRIIGFAKSTEMYLTGKIYDAKEAKEMGLLNEMVPAGELEKATTKWATMIAENAPIAVSLTKKALKASWKSDLQTTLDLLSSYQGISQRTDDHFEGLAALKEKRAPNFQGK